MPIYINKDNQQTGPFEDNVVIDQLRSGKLSPTDMGIRPGDASWQSLGDMFPGASASKSTTTPIGASVSSAAPVASVAPAAKKGGCLKFGLIGTGLLLLLLGVATAVGSRFIPSNACDLAESDARKIDKLRSDLDKANKDYRYDRIGAIQVELNSELAGAEVSQRYCDSDKSRNDMIGIAGGIVAVLGFLMAVVGLFVRRKNV